MDGSTKNKPRFEILFYALIFHNENSLHVFLILKLLLQVFVLMTDDQKSQLFYYCFIALKVDVLSLGTTVQKSFLVAGFME